MFYLENVTHPEATIPGASTLHSLHCNSEIFKMAKKTLTLNFATLWLFIIIVPNRILAIVLENKEDHDMFVHYSIVMGPFRIISVLTYQVLILRKINEDY